MRKESKLINLAYVFSSLCLVFVAIMFNSLVAKAAVSVPITVQYRQTNARQMISLVNDFRTSNTWYWNADNTTKTNVSGLSSLEYDYQLERVAMLRAYEIAVNFEHDRPNGGGCFSAYSEVGYDCGASGENIAAGYTTYQSAFEGWKEENKNYDGQGHRRNMLGPYYNRIGIACVSYNGRYYWVQELAYSNSSITNTTANDSTQTVNISFDQSKITQVGTSRTEVTLNCGNSGSIKEMVPVSIKTAETWPGTYCPTNLNATWSSSDSSVLAISGDTYVAKKTGTSIIRTTALGTPISVKIIVNHQQSTGVVTKEATCTEDGIKTYTCPGCMYSYTEAIKAKGHTKTYVSATQPTCTEPGKSSGYICSKCNEVLTQQTTQPATGHDYVLWDGTYPTCTRDGEEEYICFRCWTTKIEVVKATGHTMEDYTQAPTCTEDGYIGKKCKYCSEAQKTTILKATGHVWGEEVITATPTYSCEGQKHWDCIYCDERKYETIPKKGSGGNKNEGSNDPFHLAEAPDIDPNTSAPFYHWIHTTYYSFWYEGGVKQGTYDDPKGVYGFDDRSQQWINRGREICDQNQDAWFWLDSVLGGAKAVNKEVWVPYIYQNEKDWKDNQEELDRNAALSGDMAEQVKNAILNGEGKWVRYNSQGQMIKGWFLVDEAVAQIYPDQLGNWYYYDPQTGLMAKGWVLVDDIVWHFDEVTGVLDDFLY